MTCLILFWDKSFFRIILKIFTKWFWFIDNDYQIRYNIHMITIINKEVNMKLNYTKKCCKNKSNSSYIKRILTNDPILYNLRVKGEVSNFKVHSSGNVYLSLKDESQN